MQLKTRDIPFEAICVSAGDLVSDSLRVLSALLKWDEKVVQVKVLEDGITNLLVLATHPETKEKVLVRTFGKNTDIFIDRDREFRNFNFLHSFSLCPDILGRFSNGIVYRYVEGHTLDGDGMRNHRIKIAEELAVWHSLPSRGEQPELFNTLTRWVKSLPDKCKTTPKSVEQSPIEEKYTLIKGKIEKEIAWLKAQLEPLNSAVTFCHNDLLGGNIIYSQGEDKIRFIDYEYGTFSFRGFDIANHFNEWAGFDCDWDRFPSDEVALEFLQAYLNKLQSKENPHKLLREVMGFALASHVFWGLWALIQADISLLDFDFLSYGLMRFEQYEIKKREWITNQS